MLQSPQIEELICLVSSLDRQTLTEQFLNFRGQLPGRLHADFSTSSRSTDCGTSSSRCACRTSTCRSCECCVSPYGGGLVAEASRHDPSIDVYFLRVKLLVDRS